MKIPQLETLSIGKRIVLAVVIVLLVFGLLFFINRIVGEDEAHAQSPQLPEVQCVSNELINHVRQQVLAALDQAVQQHVAHLFDIWIKDPSDQPKRAVEGMNVGLSAYVRARRNALSWDPIHCPTEVAFPRYKPSSDEKK
jgi:hypothetical protein